MKTIFNKVFVAIVKDSLGKRKLLRRSISDINTPSCKMKSVVKGLLVKMEMELDVTLREKLKRGSSCRTPTSEIAFAIGDRFGNSNRKKRGHFALVEKTLSPLLKVCCRFIFLSLKTIEEVFGVREASMETIFGTLSMGKALSKKPLLGQLG